jgi:pentatricopeptide repeat protein
MTDFVQTVQEVFTTLSQEITVILVFFISLTLWKYVGERKKAVRKQKSMVSSPDLPKPLTTANKKVEQSANVEDSKAMLAIQAAEVQMVKLLESREFTRALNLFRTFERNGRDRYFSESLFSAFIQSAIRVGKIDVVERLLRTMKQRGSEPSCEFWRTTLKMLSSRKHFEACLTIYSIWGNTLPADKVVFSCLINVTLENAVPERAVPMLERYCEAGLEPKDYVLLFRTYVAVNDVDAAEKAFRRLGSDLTSMMVNLVILTCVKAKEPERAYQRLQEACAFQDKRVKVSDEDEESIVDVVSYNTVIKGFAQAGILTRCFDCLQEMRARGLEPDDVSFGTLLDSCIADNDMSSANEVVSQLMRSDHAVDTVMCTMFIKALVRAHKLPKALELYEEMKLRKGEGTRPDIVTYSVLVKACVDCHNLERALSFVEDMAADGLSPDDIILTHLLEGCRYAGNHALGKKTLRGYVGCRRQALQLHVDHHVEASWPVRCPRGSLSPRRQLGEAARPEAFCDTLHLPHEWVSPHKEL